LAQRREGDDAQIDFVAGGLLVIGDQLQQGSVLIFGKALGKSRLGGGGRGIRDVRPRYAAGSNQAQRAAKN
jgi:hypothetical protein